MLFSVTDSVSSLGGVNQYNFSRCCFVLVCRFVGMQVT